MRFGVQLYPWSRWPDLDNVAALAPTAAGVIPKPCSFRRA